MSFSHVFRLDLSGFPEVAADKHRPFRACANLITSSAERAHIPDYYNAESKTIFSSPGCL
ncbi:MAG: hypothetical protein LDLANPLL_00475 [Turneriella sp.]|nr:hypothetical protein [Turneriella sp.]